MAIVVGHHLYEAGLASEILDADLDMVDHEPPEPAHDRHRPGCRLAVANGNQRARGHPIQISDLTAHPASRITSVLDLPDMGDCVQSVGDRTNDPTGAVGN